MPQKVCPQCNTIFKAPHHVQKFCSRTCWRKSIIKKVERICQACGKTFLARRFKVKEGKALYCSRECANAGWDEPCANCGKMVHRSPFHAKRFDNVFCSRQCYSEWSQDRVELTCQQCAKGYVVKRSHASRFDNAFCSRQCYFESKAQEIVTLTCEQCGASFERPKSFINPNMYHGRFCSNACTAIARRLPDSVRSEYNHEFTPKLKREVRQRDDLTCQECGKHGPTDKVRLDVHHIDYDKTNNHPSNLITLCRSCHSKTNYRRPYWQERYSGYINSHI